MVVLVILSSLAERLRFPSPIMLMVAGLVIGLTPGLPNLALDPEIVFLIILPPLLFDAASKTAWYEFKAAIRPISTLAIALVIFTTVAVAMAAHYCLPGFSWPLAFVLGAIVSPPDAVAATSITKGLQLNKRVITILEGESLVNDASALIAYRYAVAAVTTGSFVFWKAGLQFLGVAIGGIAVGLVVAFVFVLVSKRVSKDPVVQTSLLLLMPFLAYLLGEAVHTSGVLAVVSAGLLISWRAPEIISFQTRVQNKSVWDTIIFLLNGFVFLLIGLQVPDIMRSIGNYTVGQLVGYGALISAATILVRIVWVFIGAYHNGAVELRKTSTGKQHAAADDDLWKHVLIVAWTGTRGIVSLATALALPLTLSNGALFPQRSLILFLAFMVIFITLVVQGLSLPLLIRALKVKKAASNGTENKELELFMASSVLAHLQDTFPIELEEELHQQLKTKYEERVQLLEAATGEEAPAANTDEGLLSQDLQAQIEIARFQRRLLVQLHKEGRFADETIRHMESSLDINSMKLNIQRIGEQQ
jgi:CPA1 family monovalent cation:H+ antiporter